MIVIRKFVVAVEADIAAIVAKLEAQDGVKVIAKYVDSIIVGIEKDVGAIAKDPKVIAAYQAIEDQVKKDIEAIGNTTVKQIVDFEIGFIKKVCLAIKKFFQLLFAKK